MSAITTHVLDTVLGKPAAGITIHLEKQSGLAWITAGDSATDIDGRCRNLSPEGSEGTYRITFDVGPYFEIHGRRTIYPQIVIIVQIDADKHYHLPLLLSENSYTTYRGS
jgi:5-hydroxyisourate hydrolase